MIEVTIKNKSNEALTLAMNGSLDTVSAVDAERDVTELISDYGLNITIVLAELSYISSSGLRLLLALKKRSITAGGQLKLVGMNEMVRKVFTITGLDTLLL